MLVKGFPGQQKVKWNHGQQERLRKNPANDMPTDGLAPAYSDDHILLLHRYGTDPGRVHADLSWSDTEWFSSVEISIPMVLVDHIKLD